MILADYRYRKTRQSSTPPWLACDLKKLKLRASEQQQNHEEPPCVIALECIAVAAERVAF